MNSYMNMPGYFAYNVGVNEEMTKLRERERSESGCAEFSNDVLRVAPQANSGGVKRLGDVPIAKLVGISTTANLDNYEEGMTFGEILFQCLHGASLNAASIDYLCGDAVKSEGYPGYEEFPQIPDISSKNPKYKAKFDISFDCINGEYYCNQGQQRSIIARYAIYQRFGIGGKLKNVGINDIPDSN